RLRLWLHTGRLIPAWRRRDRRLGGRAIDRCDWRHIGFGGRLLARRRVKGRFSRHWLSGYWLWRVRVGGGGWLIRDQVERRVLRRLLVWQLDVSRAGVRDGDIGGRRDDRWHARIRHIANIVIREVIGMRLI